MRITNAKLRMASLEEVDRGLLARISCVTDDGIAISGLKLRRSVDGHLYLAFPFKRDARGRAHFFLRPQTDRVRREIQEQVFRLLHIDEVGECP